MPSKLKLSEEVRRLFMWVGWEMGTIDAPKEEFEDVAAKVERLEKELVLARAQADAAHSVLEDVRQENFELHVAVEKLEADHTDSEKALIDEVTRLRSHLDDATKIRTDLLRHIRELERANDGLQDEVEKQKSLVEVWKPLTEAHAKQYAHIQDLKIEIAVLKDEVDHWKLEHNYRVREHDEHQVLIRDEALEAAAKAVEDCDVVERGSGYMRGDDGSGTLRAAASSIRALKSGGKS